jgi:hypothetical protein
MLARLLPGSTALARKRDFRDARLLQDTDVAVVSFPKSGRTFLRVMLSHIYHLQFGLDHRLLMEHRNFHDIDPRVPRVLFTHDGDAMRKPSEVRIDYSRYIGRKVILLTRHPADVAISRYYHLRNRSRDEARRRLAQQDLDQFVWTEWGGIPSIVAFLNEWHGANSYLPEFLIVRYENLVRHPLAAITALLQFLQVQLSDEQIERVARFSTFENMKQLERSKFFSTDRFGARQRGNESSVKVRSGKCFGYAETLSAENVRKVNLYLAEFLHPSLCYG